MAEGSRTARTSVASMRIAAASPTPSCLNSKADNVAKIENTATITMAALVTVPAERVWQVGMRTGSREEYVNRRPNFFPVMAGHPVDVVRRLLPALRAHPLYVTIDVDVLDPSEAPGTGSPEPGGLRVPELLEIVRLLSGCRVIGGDLVEVAHAWDPTGRTGIAASWVIREAILAWWGRPA